MADVMIKGDGEMGRHDNNNDDDDDDDDDNNDDDDDDDDDIQIFAVPNMQRNAINVEPVLNFKLKEKG